MPTFFQLITVYDSLLEGHYFLLWFTKHLKRNQCNKYWSIVIDNSIYLTGDTAQPWFGPPGEEQGEDGVREWPDIQRVTSPLSSWIHSAKIHWILPKVLHTGPGTVVSEGPPRCVLQVPWTLWRNSPTVEVTVMEATRNCKRSLVMGKGISRGKGPPGREAHMGHQPSGWSPNMPLVQVPRLVYRAIWVLWRSSQKFCRRYTVGLWWSFSSAYTHTDSRTHSHTNKHTHISSRSQRRKMYCPLPSHPKPEPKPQVPSSEHFPP